MKNSKITIRFGVLSLMVLIAAFSRLIPHPPNFAPIGAIALFGVAYFRQKYFATQIPDFELPKSILIIQINYKSK